MRTGRGGVQLKISGYWYVINHIRTGKRIVVKEQLITETELQLDCFPSSVEWAVTRGPSISPSFINIHGRLSVVPRVPWQICFGCTSVSTVSIQLDPNEIYCHLAPQTDCSFVGMHGHKYYHLYIHTFLIWTLFTNIYRTYTINDYLGYYQEHIHAFVCYQIFGKDRQQMWQDLRKGQLGAENDFWAINFKGVKTIWGQFINIWSLQIV